MRMPVDREKRENSGADNSTTAIRDGSSNLGSGLAVSKIVSNRKS